MDQELLLRNEYLAAENRILRGQIKGRVLLSDAEATLAEIAHRPGREALKEVAAAAKPDTLTAWYRQLIAKKFDGSRFRKSVGRPPVEEEIERLVVGMARENPSWGYDRIVGAMANLGHEVSDHSRQDPADGHGPIYPPYHRIRRSPRHRGWDRIMSDVQASDSMANGSEINSGDCQGAAFESAERLQLRELRCRLSPFAMAIFGATLEQPIKVALRARRHPIHLYRVAL